MWNIMPSSNDSEEFEFWKVLFQKHTNVTNCYNFSNLETRIIGFEWSQWWELDRCRNQPRYFRQYYKIILVGFRSFQLWIHCNPLQGNYRVELLHREIPVIITGNEFTEYSFLLFWLHFFPCFNNIEIVALVPVMCTGNCQFILQGLKGCFHTL